MNIALLGMGTVGGGVVEIAAGLEGIHCRRVLVRRPQADYMTADIEEIVNDPEIDLVAETMGGLHPAYEYARRTMECGKHFVTANKLLVAVYGAELTALAKEKGVAFLYGAACGGGIAYLANLKLARQTDRLLSLGGILNGTTNFILDSMQSENLDYVAALKRAQELGYAERDPSSDVDGLDTQRKLILACAVGFDSYVRGEDIPAFGISAVTDGDVAWARAHGMALRLCACAERGENGALSAYVEPTLVSLSAPEAAVRKNVNYAWYRGASCGLMSYTGQGAGRLPTASNVIRDVQSIASGARYMTGEACAPASIDNSAAAHAYYLRVEKGAELPAEWVEQGETSGAWDLYITRPMSVQAMHAFMEAQKRNRKNAFMAGIQKG